MRKQIPHRRRRSSDCYHTEDTEQFLFSTIFNQTGAAASAFLLSIQKKEKNSGEWLVREETLAAVKVRDKLLRLLYVAPKHNAGCQSGLIGIVQRTGPIDRL